MSSDGKVSFVRPGKSNVVVTSKYGGITDTCVIIVDSIHVESFELKQHENRYLEVWSLRMDLCA